MRVYVCACVRVCVCAFVCVRACVRACVCARVSLENTGKTKAAETAHRPTSNAVESWLVFKHGTIMLKYSRSDWFPS